MSIVDDDGTGPDPRLLANPLTFGEDPRSKYARLGEAYFRGSTDSELEASNTNPTKPDGTSVTKLFGGSGSSGGGLLGLLSSGNTARRVTGASLGGASFLTSAIGKIASNPLEVGSNLLGNIGKARESLGSFLGGFANASSGGPPYPNILDGFASYTCLWTLACLEPEQFNNPSSYRNNAASIKHVIFSSAGRYDSARTQTKYGVPEFFIDNINFQSIISATPASGNTNIIGFSFDIYEPYSMGLFLQSLQVSAINAGYPNYLSGAPYLLMLQFAGNTDDGAVLPVNESLTKYFTVQITKCDMNVDESGSKYAVTAVPYHHMALANSVQTLKTDARLIGSTVKEVLSTGPRSLVKVLNEAEQELVELKKQSVADQYEIIFPEDASSQSPSAISPTNLGSAIVNPQKVVSTLIKGAPGKTETLDVGSNAIGSAPMPFKSSTSGNFVYKDENEAINADLGGVVDSTKMNIDPTTREFRFVLGSKLIKVITDIILISKYATDAIDPKRFDDSGLVQWFKIDTHVEMLEVDAIRGDRAKKYIFRVVPFLVSNAHQKNPSSATAGTNNLKKIIAKRYDYVYTGQNNHVLKFDLSFNAMFFTGAHARATGTNRTRDNDTNTAANEKQVTAQSGSADTSALVSPGSGSTVVKNTTEDNRLFKISPVGDKTTEQEVAEWFQKRFEDASSDLISVEVEIVGDPYFLSDSGINTNYNAPPGPNSQIRADGAFNYEGSEIFIFMIFRTPVEPNLAVSGDGGLYSFAGDGGISPFSGIFKLNKVQNKWVNGTYTQTLEMIRILGQDGDLIGKENIILANLPVYREPVALPEKQSPAADTGSQTVDSEYVETPEETEKLLQNAENLKQSSPGVSRKILPDGTEVIDIRPAQRAASSAVFAAEYSRTGSERLAENARARAGNLAGVEAFQSIQLNRRQ